MTTLKILSLTLLCTINFSALGLDTELPPLDLGDSGNSTTWSSLFRSRHACDV